MRGPSTPGPSGLGKDRKYSWSLEASLALASGKKRVQVVLTRWGCSSSPGPGGNKSSCYPNYVGAAFPGWLLLKCLGLRRSAALCELSLSCSLPLLLSPPPALFPSCSLPLQLSLIATQSSSDTLATPLIIRVLHGREGCRLDFVSPPDVRLAAAWFQLTAHVL